MSGLDALRNRARHVCGGLTMLRHDVPTMADVFKAGGYRTGMFGKWHLGDSYPYLPQYRGSRKPCITSPGASPRRRPLGQRLLRRHVSAQRKPQKYEGYCGDVWFREAMIG